MSREDVLNIGIRLTTSFRFLIFLFLGVVVARRHWLVQKKEGRSCCEEALALSKIRTSNSCFDHTCGLDLTKHVWACLWLPQCLRAAMSGPRCGPRKRHTNNASQSPSRGSVRWHPFNACCPLYTFTYIHSYRFFVNFKF